MENDFRNDLRYFSHKDVGGVSAGSGRDTATVRSATRLTESGGRAARGPPCRGGGGRRSTRRVNGRLPVRRGNVEQIGMANVRFATISAVCVFAPDCRPGRARLLYGRSRYKRTGLPNRDANEFSASLAMGGTGPDPVRRPRKTGQSPGARSHPRGTKRALNGADLRGKRRGPSRARPVEPVQSRTRRERTRPEPSACHTSGRFAGWRLGLAN